MVETEDFIEMLTGKLDLQNVWVFKEGGYSLNIRDVVDLLDAASEDPIMVSKNLIHIHTKLSISHIQLSEELERIKKQKERRASEVTLDAKSDETLKKTYGRVTAQVIQGLVSSDEQHKALEEMEASYKRAKDVVSAVKDMLFQMSESVRYIMKYWESMPKSGTKMSSEEAEEIIKRFMRDIEAVDTQGLINV